MNVMVMMKRMLLLWVSAVVSACSTVPTEQMCGLPQAETREAVVHIFSSSNSTASGVVIGQDRVISVAHAFKAHSSINIAIDGQLKAASIISLDEGRDLALLSVDTGSLKPVTLSDTPLVENETLWALGYPLSNAQKLSLGLFKDFFEDQLYTTNHINSGGSGGGLLHCDGGQFELAGVVHGYVVQVEGNDYINIGDSTSIPSSTIKHFIENAEIKNILGSL